MLTALHHISTLYHNITHISSTLSSLPSSNMSSSLYDRCISTVEHLRSRLPPQISHPRIAIVCGSGLGGLANAINTAAHTESWEYKDIPHFPTSTVPGHAGRIIFSTMTEKETPVVLLVGRAHFYEGHSMSLVTYAMRVCKLLGVETVILTNAAGGLNPSYSVGDIVCLNDHLNLAGLVGFHPLRGPNEDDFGVRFPPLSDAYDLRLRQMAHQAWKDIRKADATPGERKLHEGVYAYVAGPSYETRAECRMLRQLGADVVGMSTVPEIVVARHCSMRVLAFSLVTNQAVLESTVRGDDPELEGLSTEELDAYLSRGKANHEEVLEAGKQAALDMQSLVLKLVAQL